MHADEIRLCCLADTQRLGATIGNAIVSGDLIYLDGELGAGKTTLTKNIAVALGVPAESVTSPTFTLVHEYRGGKTPLVHLDLYRLNDPRELEQLGFDDYVASGDGAVIVEWAVRAGDRLPVDALSLRIKIDHAGQDSRTVSMRSGGARSAELLEQVKRSFSC